MSSGCYNFCRPHALLSPQLARSQAPAVPAAATAAAAAADTCTAPARQPTATAGSGQSAVDGSGWLLACAGPDTGDVAVWDMRLGSASEAAHIPAPPPPTRFASNPDSSMPKSHGMAMSVQLLASPACNKTADGAADSRRVLVGYESGGVALWDTRSPRVPLGMAEAVHSETVLALRASPDGTFAVSGSADNGVGVLAIGQQRQQQPQGHADIQQGDSATQPCGSTCSTDVVQPLEQGTQPCSASAGEGGCELQLVARMELPKPGVGDVAIRDDGRIFAVGGWDGKVSWCPVEKRSL